MQGFDFAFVRRSQLYNECSRQSKYERDSEYIGERTLAVRSGKASPSAAGAPTLSTKNQQCWIFFPISRSTTSKRKGKDGLLSKESELSDDQEQHPTEERHPQLR